jgi:hypothetical protein
VSVAIERFPGSAPASTGRSIQHVRSTARMTELRCRVRSNDHLSAFSTEGNKIILGKYFLIK